jgi:hypothetical protein
MEYVSMLRNVSRSQGGGASLEQANLTANHTAWVANMSSGTGAALRCATSTDCHLEATDLSFNHSFTGGGGALALSDVYTLTDVNSHNNSLDCDCDETQQLGGNPPTNLEPGYLDQGEIIAGVASAVGSGVSTRFFDKPWTWDLHLDPDADPIGLLDVLSPLTDPDPDGLAGDLGIYGGLHAHEWDLDGDGAPQAWKPGGYAAAVLAGEAVGLDCNDTSPFVWNGSPWIGCP